MNTKINFCFGLILFLAYTAYTQTEEEIWSQIVTAPTEDNINMLIALNPESALFPKLETLLWGKCKAKGDKNACELYVEFFQESEHVAEAFEIITRADNIGDIIEEAGEVVVDIIEAIKPDSTIVRVQGEEDLNPDDEETLDASMEPASGGADEPPISIPQKKGVSRSVAKTKKPDGATRTKNTEVQSNIASVKKSITLQFVRTEHNFIRNKRKGVLFRLKFKVSGYAGKACIATVHFLDEDGQALVDTNGKYVNMKGKVVSVRKFTPKLPVSQYTTFELFMPYGELHKKGKNKILYYVTIRSGNIVLAKSAKGSFTLNWR